jgi:hypothetical membrane protein
MGRDHLSVAGALAFVGATQFIIALSIAQSIYPGYNVSSQPISDLGATCVSVLNNPGTSPSSSASVCTIPVTATLFDSSVFLLGLLAFISACLIFRAGSKALGVTFMLGGIGAMGVGIFPETTGSLHTLVSFVAFFFGGISAVISYRSTRPPLSYFSVVLGVVTLLALVLYGTSTYLGLGQGGMERLIAYPALLWIVGFGASMMSRERPK